MPFAVANSFAVGPTKGGTDFGPENVVAVCDCFKSEFSDNVNEVFAGSLAVAWEKTRTLPFGSGSVVTESADEI